MADYPYLPLWTDAYLGDTYHLLRDEHGAYLLLLMAAWRRPECNLPDDDDLLARWCKSDRRTWKRLRKTVLETFWRQREDGTWEQRKLTNVRAILHAKSEQARAAADAKHLKYKEGRHANAPLPQMQNGDSAGAANVPTKAKAKAIVSEDTKDVSSGASSEAPAEPLPFSSLTGDCKTLLFNEALVWLSEVNGKNRGACRNLIGRWRKLTGHDDGALFQLMGQAESLAAAFTIIDPISWIESELKPSPAIDQERLARLRRERGIT